MSQHTARVAPKVKRCHWCGAEATGTALAALWENGRVVSRLGGRFASCAKQHGTGYTALDTTTPAANPAAPHTSTS
jgi:hypothetical protein